MTVNKNSSFSQLLQKAQLFVYGLSRGTILFTPRSFKIWEQVVQYLDFQFKKAGVENVSFPALIPLSVLRREQENFKGFAPELLLITQVGEKQLPPDEFLTLRPTSEVVFCHYFRQILRSYRDLPILLNQWTNVWRWEKNTNPFLRTTEFLWHEGHSLHETAIKAKESVVFFSKIYGEFLQKVLLLPIIHGVKSISERFAGAEETLTFETLLPDGQFLQLATAHVLGQKFAQIFELSYLNQKNQLTFPWQTSWGLSTRVLAAVFLTHRDEKGLILPPQIADVQVVILLLTAKESSALAIKIEKVAQQIFSMLQRKNYRVKMENDQHKSFGYWTNEYEMRGIPLRLEIGSKEVAKEKVTAVFRTNSKKISYSVHNFIDKLPQIWQTIEQEMRERASLKMQNKKITVADYAVYRKFTPKNASYEAPFCGEIICENQIKNETETTSRVLWSITKSQPCFRCQKNTKYLAIFGRSY